MSDTRGRETRPGRHTTGSATSDPELAALRTHAAFHQRLRDLTLEFSQQAAAAGALDAALGGFADGANILLGARQTTVWLHQRSARTLTARASSDAGSLRATERVPTTAADAPAARGLRLERARLEADRSLLLVPLRGWRRALGTLVAQGPFVPALDEDLLEELSHELGRQLAAAIESVQLLEQVLRQRRLLEDTFNSLVDLVVVTDTELRLVQTNEVFAARVGQVPAELHGRPLGALVDRALADWIAATAHDGAGGAGGEHDARSGLVSDARLAGEFAVTMTPLVNHVGEAVGHVVVLRDITAQRQLEAEREALRARLAQSEKLAALGQFVAGVAHEMNNPLQGVLGHLELMMETADLPPAVKRDMRRIYHEADRAAKIVQNLLTFSGARRMERRRLRPARVVSRALVSRADALRRGGIRVARSDAEHAPWISGDPQLLHQALVNVLVNAEHAVADVGGDARIEIATRAGAAGGRVAIVIRDNGPGIPADALPRIFDPFFTTKDVGKGTGLGLAITYGIIQEHGGTIHAANDPGGGAVITIDLPGQE